MRVGGGYGPDNCAIGKGVWRSSLVVRKGGGGVGGGSQYWGRVVVVGGHAGQPTKPPGQPYLILNYLN